MTIAAFSFGTAAMLMQALNPASRSGINVSAALSCKRMVLPIVNHLHNIAKEKTRRLGSFRV
jgi:hypothetical protein